MPRRFELLAQVDDDGRLARSIRVQIESYLGLYAGGEVAITLGPKKRSTAANRFYWSCIISPIRLALLESGQAHSAEVIHEHFKRRYLDVTTEELFGYEYARYTTTKLDSTQFHYYIEAIKHDEDVIALAVVFPDDDPVFQSYSIAEPI